MTFTAGFRPGSRFANLAYIASYTAQQKGIPVTFSKTSRNRCLYQVAKKGIVARQPRPKIYNSNFLFPLLALPTLPSCFFFPFREMNFPESFNGVLCNETSQVFIGRRHNRICDHQHALKEGKVGGCTRQICVSLVKKYVISLVRQVRPVIILSYQAFTIFKGALVLPRRWTNFCQASNLTDFSRNR